MTAVFLLVSLFASTAAFPPSTSRVVGKWVLNASESDSIERAIDQTVASMNFVARPVARGKLKRRSVAFPSMLIEVDSRGLRVQHERGLDVVFPGPGVDVKTHATDGSDVVCRAAPEPVLTLSYDAEDGKREDRYMLNVDGSKLTLMVHLTSPKLPKALEYKLVYQRPASTSH